MLNAKFLEEKIKNGWTVEDFTNHFNTTPEDFFATLERFLSPKAARHYKAEIAKNAKQARHKKIQITNITEEFSILDVPEKTKEPVCENTSETICESSQEKSDLLEKLKIQEAELLQKICDLELEHKDYVSSRIQAQNEIREIKKELEAIQKEVKNCKITLAKKIQFFNEKGQKMAEINNAISEARTTLEHVREEILSASVILIYVYDSDLISEASFEVKIPEEWESIYEDLRRKDELEDFTGKQLKSLAKAMALKAIHKDAEFIFENSDLEKFFASFSEDN